MKTLTDREGFCGVGATSFITRCELYSVVTVFPQTLLARPHSLDLTQGTLLILLMDSVLEYYCSAYLSTPESITLKMQHKVNIRKEVILAMPYLPYLPSPKTVVL